MKMLSLVPAVALVILTDAVVLLNVWANRSSVVQEIELTERELPLEPRGEDNTGVTLRLSEAHSLGWLAWADTPDWFNQAKLAELGFDVHVPPGDPAADIFYRNVLRRDAFVVLEYGGPVWEKHVRDADESRPQAQATTPLWNPRNETRLVAVDAGRDPGALRGKYPDTSKYLIVRAVVRLADQMKWDPNARQFVPPKVLRGEIQTVMPDEIHVPLPEAAVLAALPAGAAPRYAVTLRYGKHYEPWVVKVRRM